MQQSAYYFIAIALLIASQARAQTPVYEMDVVNGQVINTCGGLFTDSNPGSGHYANGENYQVSFCSTNGTDLLNFNFGSGSDLTIERLFPGDTLYIYDGIGTSGTLLAAVSGNAANTNRIDVLGGSTGDFRSLSSCITFVFRSNASNNDDGWAAGITCVPATTCNGNPAAADLFGGAPFICNLNGYCGTTSASYGADYPGNLLGNVGGACPVLFGGTLQNNSWLRFEASATTVNFNVSVSNCGTDGIQIAIFDYNAATGVFTRMSNCALSDGGNTGTFALAGTGMTVGRTYYIMVDGNAGAVCDYSITASSGVAVANAGADQSVCGTATLSASPASGTWSVVSGTGTFANASSASTTVTGLSATNVFRWTTTNSGCGTVSDDVTITNSCPCNISALAAGSQTACNAGDNTYTQQVTVTYTNAPTSGTLVVNGQNFAITASPQTVTLTGLNADGLPVNVSASFSASPACSRNATALFTAPAACSGSPVCTPNNGTWD